MAVNFAYKDIKEHDRPSDNYKATRFVKCKLMIALAGYRLADWLRESIQTIEVIPAYVDMKKISGDEVQVTYANDS
jgi:hypothetical protein